MGTYSPPPLEADEFNVVPIPHYQKVKIYSMKSIENIRNIAIIAHVDHGKTTLIDSIFKSCHVFRENQHMGERVMDSDDQERERGITILAKNCNVEWGGLQINIVDTPGHADFAGEVERVLTMVDGCLLLVDVNEGPMPQTRYVLRRALALGLSPIVVLNKADRPNAMPDDTLNKTFDLFLELGATDKQASFPHLYASALEGWVIREMTDERKGMEALFETIRDYVPHPATEANGPFQMQITTLDYNDFMGQIGCGRIMRGSLKEGDAIARVTRVKMEKKSDASDKSDATEPQDSIEEMKQSVCRITKLWATRGLSRMEIESASAGEIVWVSGIDDLQIGDTLCDRECVEPMAAIEIEEPTVSMLFLVNSGPFAGQEGRPVTLRQLKDRLFKETRRNVALRVEDIGRADGVKVSGRGELQLAVLLENLRREGMELCVSRPEVITKRDEAGRLLEPFVTLVVDVPQEFSGVVIEKLAGRKGVMKSMGANTQGGTRLEFDIPTRGLIGYRNDFLTDTRGEGIMSARFDRYDMWAGELAHRSRGSMIAMESGEVTSYQIENLQNRGSLFVQPQEKIYAGQIVGENSHPHELQCNPCKKKQVSNMRSSTKEQYVRIKAFRKLSLDEGLEWIAGDELVEITPKSIRLRKALLCEDARKKASRATAAV